AASGDRAEARWGEIGGGFRARAEAGVTSVRANASELFGVGLRERSLPLLAEQEEGFFYLFLHVSRPGEGVARLALAAMPEGARRARLVKRAQAHLADELDKHAGRTTADLAERLDEARRQLVVTLSAELDEAVGQVLAAAERAGELRRQGETEHRSYREQAGEAARAIEAVRALRVPSALTPAPAVRPAGDP
ncbi:MAG: hypothetical protein ACYDH5_14160, partial [Acidimicrobiales bacterium]